MKEAAPPARVQPRIEGPKIARKTFSGNVGRPWNSKEISHTRTGAAPGINDPNRKTFALSDPYGQKARGGIPPSGGEKNLNPFSATH